MSSRMLKPPSRRQESALTRAVAAAICGAVVLGVACGAFIDATIPVRVSKKGKVLGPGEAKVKITAHVPKGTKSRSDGDAITIKCFPCTMACSPSTTTTLITTTTTTLVSGCFADTGDGTIL